MSTNEETAIRMATVLTTAMNVAAMLSHEPALQASDPVELRSTLLEIAGEMTWVGSVVARGVTAGLSWPADAAARIERLRTVAAAWNPVDPPPAEVRDAARRCLGILLPKVSGD